MARNDVIILAQASMARVADTIPPEEQKVPILSSPRLAIEALAIGPGRANNSKMILE